MLQRLETVVDAPHGLALQRLPDHADARHAEARAFCLATIVETYGIGYRADWHADLDALARGGDTSWYGRGQRGAFWILADDTGAAVATAGLYRLGLKPALVSAFAARYRDPDCVAQLGRVYIRRDWRGRRIGRWLDALVAAEAARLGYETLYLHADAGAEATLGFWRGRGYEEIARFGESVHFDRTLSSGI